MRKILIATFTILIILGGMWLIHPYIQERKLAADLTNQLTTQQYSLERFARNNAFITEHIKQLLSDLPNIARIRVAFVHPPANYTTSQDMLRFSVSQGVTRPGHPLGELLMDRPITEWNDFFLEMMNNRCAVVKPSMITIPTTLDRVHAMNVKTFVACPIMNYKAQLLGVIFVSWDEGDEIPDNFVDVMKKTKTVADLIAAFSSESL